MIDTRLSVRAITDCRGRSAGAANLRAFRDTEDSQIFQSPPLPALTEIDMSRQATLSQLIEINRFNLLAWWLLREGYPPTTVVQYGYVPKVVAVLLADGKHYRAKGYMIF